MFRYVDAAIEIEVVVGVDVRVDGIDASRIRETAAGEFGLQPADVPPVERDVEAIVRLPGGPQPVAPARHGRGRADSRTIRPVVTRAIDFGHTRCDIDRIIERDAAGKAERQVAGFRRQRVEFPYVTTLEVDTAVAVGTRIEARADDAAGVRAVEGGQRAAGVAMNQSAVERVAGVQAGVDSERYRRRTV